MNILLIDNGSKHLKKLQRLLSSNSITTIPFFSSYPDKRFDLIILSGGSRFAVNENPEKFDKEINLIKNAQTPIIGICEGCEIIAYAFGSKLEKFTPKSKGIKTIEIVDKAFLESPKEIKVYEAHHWAIKKLGQNLIEVAKSQNGFEIIKHRQKPIYGLQFHPEMFVDKTLGDEIFKQIVDRITK